jgi:hypothetical protein
MFAIYLRILAAIDTRTAGLLRMAGPAPYLITSTLPVGSLDKASGIIGPSQ